MHNYHQQYNVFIILSVIVEFIPKEMDIFGNKLISRINPISCYDLDLHVMLYQMLYFLLISGFFFLEKSKTLNKISKYIADLGKAMGCSTNTSVIK